MASVGFVRGAFTAIRGYHCLWVGVSSLSWSPSPVHHLGNTNKPINPQVFRLGHSGEFPCLQLTWEMELLLFLSNTCPCTRRRAVSRNGIWACFERPEHLPPCARALPPALAEAGRRGGTLSVNKASQLSPVQPAAENYFSCHPPCS